MKKITPTIMVGPLLFACFCHCGCGSSDRGGGPVRPEMAKARDNPEKQKLDNDGSPTAPNSDWRGFRGNRHDGIAPAAKPPVQWSAEKNLKWKTELPGPGSSSPIVLGDHMYVTCYSGYGTGRNSAGALSDLKRHLICLDRKSGKILWDKTVAAVVAEDPYSGYITQHGYASSTPVTDGERIYVFFGKTGVLAFDLQGKELWRTSVGTDSNYKKWGSGASLILYRDMVIVNASYESRSLRALDKKTGKEIWKAAARGTDYTYGSPQLLAAKNGAVEIAIAVPGEIWGLSPETGKLQWFAKSNMAGNVSPTVVTHDGVVYACGGYQQNGSMAVRAGGHGDVTNSHVLWKSRYSSYVPSMLYSNGQLFMVNDRGVAYCLNPKDGSKINSRTLRAGGGGGASRPFYASPILADGKIYAVSRTGGAFVLTADEKLTLVRHNQLSGDTSDFNASPVAVGSQLILRSNGYLYCIDDE